MTARFLIGAFVALILISLIIVAVLRGFNFIGSSKTRTQTPKSSLPVVTNTTPASPSAQMSNLPAEGSKTYNNSEMGYSFLYPDKFTLTEERLPATNEFPYLAFRYNFTMSSGQTGFGVFKAPHSLGKTLTEIINEQNEIAQRNSESPASFTLVNKLGNSLETAKFSANSPSLYALRTKNFVFYLYLLEPNGVIPGSQDDITTQIEAIANSLKFNDVDLVN